MVISSSLCFLGTVGAVTVTNQTDPGSSEGDAQGTVRTALKTENFIVEFASAPSFKSDDGDLLLLASTQSGSDDGQGAAWPKLYPIQIFNMKDPRTPIWRASADYPFIRSAIGKDSFTPGNGEYRISQDNRFLTTHQSISHVGMVLEDADLSSDSNDDKVTKIIVSGRLFYQATKDPNYWRWENFWLFGGRNRQKTGAEIIHVLDYKMSIWEKSKNELITDVEIFDLPNRHEAIQGTYDRIMLSFEMEQEEEVFGLGEQFSYWSLKGEKVPIITREQGIGRGLQPITFTLNRLPLQEPAYSGADPLSTYTAIAHYLTSMGRSAYIHNPEFSVFDFTEKTRGTIEVTSTKVRQSLFYASRPLDIIRTYTGSISGRQKILPDWVGTDGAVIGIQGGEEKVIEVVETLKNNSVPVAAVWLQDWVGTRIQPIKYSLSIPFFGNRSIKLGFRSTSTQKRLWWNWEYDREVYPNWPEFVKKMRSEYNVRVLSYVNPFLSDVEGKSPKSWTRNYFKEASEKGYLIKRWVKLPKETEGNSTTGNPNSTLAEDEPGYRQMIDIVQPIIQDPNGEWKLVDYLVSSGPSVSAGMIDLANPYAFEWFKQIIKDNMISLGVSGWMADFAEYMPFDGVTYAQMNSTKPPTENSSDFSSFQFESDPRKDPNSFHNVYPREWARLNKEAVQELMQSRNETSDIVYFMRSAYSDSPKYCDAFWNGDQLHTWDMLDGMESSIYGSLSMSLSGLSFMHSDIGGYTTLNLDPRVAIKFGEKVTQIRIPVLDRRARFVRQNRELFYRWMENGVFTSISMFRTHEGSVPDENLQVWTDTDLSDMFGFYTRMYMKLHKYRKVLMEEHMTKGYPVLRPLYLHYPHGNQAAVDMERLEFMYGPLLLVVPVTSPQVKTLNQKVNAPGNYGNDPINGGGGGAGGNTTIIIGNNQTFINSTVPDASASSEDPSFQRLSSLGAAVTNEFFSRASTEKMNSQIGDQLADSMKQASGLKSKLQKRGLFTKSSVLAPRKLPKPKHGRVFMPSGTWTHIWSNQKIIINEPLGIFITKDSPFTIKCDIGQPAVFVREITQVEMRAMIEQGLSGRYTLAGEDWKYWIDDVDNLDDLDSAEDVDRLVEMAMAKYQYMRKSLEEFLKVEKLPEAAGKVEPIRWWQFWKYL